MSHCDECNGIIDRSGFCLSCGLEAPDFKDQEFNRSVLHGAEEAGEYESRERKARKVRQYGSSRGFTCILCLEMFRFTGDNNVIDSNTKMTGIEEAGTDLTRFLLREELNAHIEVIHGGRKEYWNKVNDAKRMAKIRKLDSLNKGIGVSTNCKGSREKK